MAGLIALGACHQQAAAPDAKANLAVAGQGTALPPLPASLPLASGPATQFADAPPPSALPAAAPAPIRTVADPGASYAWIDRAAGMSDAFYDSPPDYAFDYDGVAPWAWQAADDSIEFAEPVDGGYRTYFYAAGADAPYLVSDPYYSYAYDGPALVAVYDRGGRYLPPERYRTWAPYAARYYDRAQALYRASRRDDHRAVVAANWAGRRADFAAARAGWAEDRVQQADWRAYHEAHAPQERAHWQNERVARARAEQRLDSVGRAMPGGFRPISPMVARADAAPVRLASAQAGRPAMRPVAFAANTQRPVPDRYPDIVGQPHPPSAFAHQPPDGARSQPGVQPQLSQRGGVRWAPPHVMGVREPLQSDARPRPAEPARTSRLQVAMHDNGMRASQRMADPQRTAVHAPQQHRLEIQRSMPARPQQATFHARQPMEQRAAFHPAPQSRMAPQQHVAAAPHPALAPRMQMARAAPSVQSHGGGGGSDRGGHRR